MLKRGTRRCRRPNRRSAVGAYLSGLTSTPDRLSSFQLVTLLLVTLLLGNGCAETFTWTLTQERNYSAMGADWAIEFDSTIGDGRGGVGPFSIVRDLFVNTGLDDHVEDVRMDRIELYGPYTADVSLLPSIEEDFGLIVSLGQAGPSSEYSLITGCGGGAAEVGVIVIPAGTEMLDWNAVEDENAPIVGTVEGEELQGTSVLHAIEQPVGICVVHPEPGTYTYGPWFTFSATAVVTGTGNPCSVGAGPCE